MRAAYKLLLGDAFPAADPESVLRVLWECNKPGGSSQRQINQVTGISQPNVAKLLAKMREHDWIEVSQRDPSTGTKSIHVSLAGHTVLSDFEKACHLAVMNARKNRVPKT